MTKKDKRYAGLEIKKAIILRARELKSQRVSKLDSMFILTKKGYPKDLVKKGLDLVYGQNPKKRNKLDKKDILFEVKK